MHIFFKILVKIKRLVINENHINSWYRYQNKDLLLFSLTAAAFNIRLKAIDAIVTFKDENDIPTLMQIAKNNYQKIAFKAIEAIKSLDLDNKYALDIEEIENKWSQKIEQKKNRVVSKKSNKQFDKGRMQALENLKQQLKRPMSGGKWF